MEPNPLANKACEAAGGQAELARHIGVSPSAIQQWRTGLRPIPIQHCTAIEKATGGLVTRKDLRPDDWQLIWPELVASQVPGSTANPTLIPGRPIDGSTVRATIGKTRRVGDRKLSQE